jgi:hypothetical protein
MCMATLRRTSMIPVHQMMYCGARISICIPSGTILHDVPHNNDTCSTTSVLYDGFLQMRPLFHEPNDCTDLQQEQWVPQRLPRAYCY